MSILKPYPLLGGFKEISASRALFGGNIFTNYIFEEGFRGPTGFCRDEGFGFIDDISEIQLNGPLSGPGLLGCVLLRCGTRKLV